MFKTFPEFSKLTLADRKAYGSFVKDFPAFADATFPSLMTWWNSLGQMAVSQLNGNLVVSYWAPEFEADSGLSLIGTNKIDESLCAVFDHLRARGEPARLVNVPEFVVGHVRYPELFSFKEQRSFDEYVLAISNYYPLDNMVGWRRRKVSQQLKKLDGVAVEVKPLDLANPSQVEVLLKTADKWWDKNINNLGAAEKESMILAIKNATTLEVQNVCLFIEGRLRGFCLYQNHPGGDYVILHHIRAASNKMLGYELISHLFAKWFAERGVKYININSDLGVLRLRMFMLTLGPVNFFRKYIIEPA